MIIWAVITAVALVAAFPVGCIAITLMTDDAASAAGIMLPTDK